MTNSAGKGPRLRPLFTLTIAACVAGVIYLGLGYYIYLQLARGSYGHGANDGNTPAGFHLNWDDYPDFDVTPYLCPDYQDVMIVGGDPGIDLAGWWIPGGVGESAIILCHGIHSSKANDTLLVVAGMLHRNGYGVLLFDYRDHGLSSQEDGMISLGVREYRDIIAVFEWLVQEKKIPASKIGLYGLSMGGGYAAAAFMEDQRIPAVVMESPYAHLQMIIEEELARNGFPKWLSHGAILSARLRTGDDLMSMPPLDAVGRSNGRPMLVIHGMADNRVGVHHSQMMVDQAELKQVSLTSWLVEDLEHIEAPIAFPLRYEKTLVDFYAQALKSVR